MAQVKFYRGSKKSYNAETHKDGIYFATGTNEIIMNNVPYGSSKVSKMGGLKKEDTNELAIKLNPKLDNILSTNTDGLYSTLKFRTLSGTSPNELLKYLLVKVNSTGSEVLIGEAISIPKDRTLKSVELTKIPKEQSGAGHDALKFVYNLASGSTETIYVDLSTFLTEAEAGDGLKVEPSGKFTLKLDSTQEQSVNGLPFLSIGPNGLKIQGVKDEISNVRDNFMNEDNAIKERITKEVATLNSTINQKIKDVSSSAVLNWIEI